MDNENRWGVIYCPKHSDLKRGKRRRRVEKCLNDSGAEYDFIQSESVSGVERLVRMLLNNGYKTIVIVGGDTALNDAVNCLMQVEEAERGQIAIGVIPNGKINDFARFWGLRENNVEMAVETLVKRRIKKIDVGCLRYHDREEEEKRRYFLNCVNIGFVANMMNVSRRTHHFLGRDWLSFLPTLAMLAFKKKSYKMRMKINTDDVEKPIMTVCVGNSSGYGQTPNAVPYNGMLDVSVVRHSEIMQLIEGIYLLLRRKFLNHKSVRPYRTRKVDVLKADNVPVAVDGRFVGTLKKPFTITVGQEMVSLIIP